MASSPRPSIEPQMVVNDDDVPPPPGAGGATVPVGTLKTIGGFVYQWDGQNWYNTGVRDSGPTASPDMTYDSQGRAYQWDGARWVPAPQFNNPTRAAGYQAPPQPRQGDPDLAANQAFTAEQNALTRAAQQGQFNATMQQRIEENRVAAAQAAANQAFLEKKLAVETENNRATLALQTQQQIAQQQQAARQLEYQYQQLQTQVAQFNAQQQMAVDIENDRRVQENADRRERIATDIGTTAQDAGSRGLLASKLLGMQTGGEQVDQKLARGGDFFTDESLVPLTSLLKQRDEAARGPNFLSYTPIAAPQRPGIPTPFSNPNIATDQLRAQAIADAYNSGDIEKYRSLGGTAQDTTTAAYDSGPQDDSPGVVDTSDYSGMSDFSQEQAAANSGLTGEAADAYDQAFGPGGTWGAMAKGGLARGAYIGDEEGPELHIPLGPGEALVIPHNKVKNFLRTATNGVKARKSGKPAPIAADIVGMGIEALADGGLFSQGTIFGDTPVGDQSGSRNFLREALTRALSGTPYERLGRAPTPVEVSAPGTDPLVQELGGSLSALGTGTPSDYFLRRARLLTPQGINAAAGGARRSA